VFRGILEEVEIKCVKCKTKKNKKQISVILTNIVCLASLLKSIKSKNVYTKFIGLTD